MPITKTSVANNAAKTVSQLNMDGKNRTLNGTNVFNTLYAQRLMNTYINSTERNLQIKKSCSRVKGLNTTKRIIMSNTKTTINKKLKRHQENAVR